MTPMYKISLLAGSALIACYSAHPTRILNVQGGVRSALDLDLMDLMNLPDPALIPPVVQRDLTSALERGIRDRQIQTVVIGLTNAASRHPMFKGGIVPIGIRMVRC